MTVPSREAVLADLTKTLLEIKRDTGLLALVIVVDPATGELATGASMDAAQVEAVLTERLLRVRSGGGVVIEDPTDEDVDIATENRKPGHRR